MKKLLILAYDFPPFVSVGGLRPYAWYKYLKEYEVIPIVVTRQWSNKYGNEQDYIAPSSTNETIVEQTEYGTIIRTPYKPNFANRIMLKYGCNKFVLIRKMITAWYEFMQFLFFVGPKSGLYRGAEEYLKRNKVDAIIATGEPFVLFKYASTLSKKYNIPWIADYRDPWTQNKNRSNFLGKLTKYFEKKITANVNCVITVDEFSHKQIETNVQKPFYIIPNGYNSEVIKQIEHIVQSRDVFRIALAGTIYDWHPYKSVLFSFVKFLQKSNYTIKIELNFFGINKHEEIRQFVRDNNLEKYIHVYPRMDNVELLQNLSKQNVMLLFNDYSIMGTKIYDYLAIKRKIILCYADDYQAKILKQKFYPYSLSKNNTLSSHLQEDLINSTNSGIIVKNKEHLSKVLSALYNEFSTNGYIECNSTNIEKYSRKEGVKQLSNLILATINANSNID